MDARTIDAISTAHEHATACCGHCGSTFLRRARREPWQRVAFAFSPLRPYECWHCGWSAWLEAPEAPSLPSLARLTQALPRPGVDTTLWLISGVFLLGALVLNL